jgi:hypothetical protein
MAKTLFKALTVVEQTMSKQDVSSAEITRSLKIFADSLENVSSVFKVERGASAQNSDLTVIHIKCIALNSEIFNLKNILKETPGDKARIIESTELIKQLITNLNLCSVELQKNLK